MEINNKKILVCNCEGTMALNTKALCSTFSGEAEPISQLCRAQLEVFEETANRHNELIVACTQEAPIFLEAIDELETAAPALSFCNIREKAGWCNEKPGEASSNLTAKMAALLTESSLEIPQTTSVTMVSEGNVIIIGKDDLALNAASKIATRLDVTVILSEASGIPAPRIMNFPVFQGQVTQASGHLGEFKLTVNQSSPASPSSRSGLAFTLGSEIGVIDCDLILDLRGGPPLLNAPEKRDGYFLPDPRNPAAVSDAILSLIDLVGEFEKPRYVDYDPDICAHSKSEISGCTNCIDACPTGAIAPDGDKVNYDPYICAGCGNCASSCPTGAAKYAMPAGDAFYERLRILLTTYRKAGGSHAAVLIHDATWGEDMIASMARFGGGLPAHVLPFAVNQITATGLEALLAAAAYGAEYIYILVGPEKANEMNEVHSAITLANFILNNIGYGEDRISAIDDLDPDAVSQHLYSCEARPGMPNADFISMGRKRSIMNQALHSLHINAKNPVDVIALPEGAPFGSIEVDIDGCTLCLACVGACPTGAMKDNPETPQLSFNEQSCVQCGLCKKTCPENVISLKPQISFLETARTFQVVKEEEPFECVRCGKPFGTKSTIEKMTSKLKGHHMFAEEKSLDRLRMCEDCRVIALTENDAQPMALGTVPVPRTTDDYLMEREKLRMQAEADIRDKNLNVPEKDKT